MCGARQLKNNNKKQQIKCSTKSGSTTNYKQQQATHILHTQNLIITQIPLTDRI